MSARLTECRKHLWRVKANMALKRLLCSFQPWPSFSALRMKQYASPSTTPHHSIRSDNPLSRRHALDPNPLLRLGYWSVSTLPSDIFHLEVLFHYDGQGS